MIVTTGSKGKCPGLPDNYQKYGGTGIFLGILTKKNYLIRVKDYFEDDICPM